MTVMLHGDWWVEALVVDRKESIGLAALGEYRHEDRFNAGQPIDVCQPAPFGAPGTLTCDTFVVDPPSHSMKSVGSVDIKAGVSAGAGFDLKLSWAKATTGIDGRS